MLKAGAAAMLLPCAQGAGAVRRTPDFYLTRLAYESGDWEAAPKMAANVLAALDASTSSRVDPVERVVALGDTRMLGAPFCFFGGRKLVQFSAVERHNFERYVRAGGFVFVNNCAPAAGSVFASSFEAEMARLFGAQALQRVPSTHPLFASFYRFDGPPATSRELTSYSAPQPLRALFLGGRIRVLYSNKDYASEWADGVSGSLRFAINIIEYALGA